MKKILLFTKVLLLILLSNQLNAQINLNEGLVAYYPFNGNANDESGNGYNAVDVNATLTTDRLGNTNSAYYFNGVDNYINLGNILNDVFTTNTFSINMWFNAESYTDIVQTSQSAMLLDKWNTSPGTADNSFILWLKHLRMTTGGNQTGSTNDFSLNVWNMVTIVMNTGTLSKYLNGELVSTTKNNTCYT